VTALADHDAAWAWPAHIVVAPDPPRFTADISGHLLEQAIG
jgi:hypothetical protein